MCMLKDVWIDYMFIWYKYIHAGLKPTCIVAINHIQTCIQMLCTCYAHVLTAFAIARAVLWLSPVNRATLTPIDCKLLTASRASGLSLSYIATTPTRTPTCIYTCIYEKTHNYEHLSCTPIHVYSLYIYTYDFRYGRGVG